MAYVVNGMTAAQMIERLKQFDPNEKVKIQISYDDGYRSEMKTIDDMFESYDDDENDKYICLDYDNLDW